MSPDQGAAPASSAAVKAARDRLDAWVREVVAWHFDPETGPPFWIERAKGLGWDPRQEVRGFDDLARFGPFDDAELRAGDVRRWVPRAFAGRAVHVFEAGGSTPARGLPRQRIEVEDFRTDFRLLSEALPDASFPGGADWLALAPTGPRRFRLALEHLAQVRGGICFGLDLDPRWVSGSLRRGNIEGAEAYKEHVIDQALTILRSQPNVRCVFASPKLLEALSGKVSLARSQITGVVCGGDRLTADFHREAREEILDGIEMVAVYTNTFLGVARQKPFTPADDHVITYHAPQPRAVLQVVDPADPRREVPHGEAGRVKVTTLTKETFIPGLLERDEAVRSPPIALCPWDGVRDVRPLARPGAAAGGG
jgi:hypothetical protein